jgi:sugar phosphate isomerase/epimerase
MRLGFYTDYSPEIATFAQDVGFGCLQLSAWPQSSLNADTITDERIAEIRADLDQRDIEISALGYYPNPLDVDESAASEARRYLLKVIELAERIGVKTVCTFAGQTQGRTVAECLPAFAEIYKPICEHAEAHGVRIGIENCPMRDHRTGHGENIAYSPEIWDAMFEAVKSEVLGLQLDPSHLCYQQIDYIAAVQDYGERIFHVHAKDVDIDVRKRSRLGVFGQALGDLPGFGNGWWRFRAPGWGVIDWPALISALLDVEYVGNLDIEHEDEVFAAATLKEIGGEADIVEMFGREQNGLILGFRHLSQLVPPLEGSALLPGPERVFGAAVSS